MPYIAAATVATQASAVGSTVLAPEAAGGGVAPRAGGEGRRQPQIPPCLQPPQATTCLKTSPRGQRQTPTSNQAARRRLIELEPLLTRRRGGRFGSLHVRCHHRSSGRGRSNFDARSLKCSGDGSWCDGRAARVGCDGVVHNHLHSKQVRLSRRWTTTNAAAAARNMA
jgi:hypothetical protein